jgi:ABC-type cobalamin/Fe3+-siderophores transport system ATPase subunit
MLSGAKFAQGPAGEVLNEENLHALYGVDLKLLSFEHKGVNHETLVPVLPYASRARILPHASRTTTYCDIRDRC